MYLLKTFDKEDNSHRKFEPAIEKRKKNEWSKCSYRVGSCVNENQQILGASNLDLAKSDADTVTILAIIDVDILQ